MLPKHPGKNKALPIDNDKASPYSLAHQQDAHMATLIDLTQARKARQFERDLKAARQPRRATKATRQAVAAQAVRLAARGAL